MKRLIDETVFSGVTAACRRASCPTSRSPDLVNATTEGVVREPSEFGMTTGSPPSMTAMTELVVPKSIPTVFGICQLFLQAALVARVQCLPLSCSPPQPHQNATGARVEFRSRSAPNLSLDPMAIFELDPVDDIAVVAVGQPGQRRFFSSAQRPGPALSPTPAIAGDPAPPARPPPMPEAAGGVVTARAPGGGGGGCREP